jgi:hypothetical protein
MNAYQSLVDEDTEAHSKDHFHAFSERAPSEATECPAEQEHDDSTPKMIEVVYAFAYMPRSCSPNPPIVEPFDVLFNAQVVNNRPFRMRVEGTEVFVNRELFRRYCKSTHDLSKVGSFSVPYKDAEHANLMALDDSLSMLGAGFLTLPHPCL